MTYLLDTNTCIRYLNGRAVGVVEQMRTLPPHEIVVCSVVKAELFYGALKSTDAARTLSTQQVFLSRFVSLPFDDRAAEAYGRIRARLSARGTPIGPNDLMIAAIAVTHGLTLVTHNVREFGRIEELSLADWEATQGGGF